MVKHRTHMTKVDGLNPAAFLAFLILIVRKTKLRTHSNSNIQ